MNYINTTTFSDWFITRSRSYKRIISLCFDFCVLVFSLWLAFSLRFSEVYQPPIEQIWIFLLSPLIALPVFIQFGLYRAIIRYIGISALGLIFKAVALYSLVFSVIVLLSGEYSGLVPRTVYGINALIVILFLASSRLSAKWWFASEFNRGLDSELQSKYRPTVLIYGAGEAGRQLAAALNAGKHHKVIGFIDDDTALHNQSIDGLIAYPIEALEDLIEKFNVRDVLLAMPSISKHRRNEIIENLEPYSVHVKTLPDLGDLAEGKITVSDIREVDITDLLGRDSVEPIQVLLHANITNKSVMITGAGGSIGSELCRQILKLQPKILILYELNEFNLYSIDKELQSYELDFPIIAILGTVQNQDRIEKVCAKFNVETIYHAAAYKHVPLVEQNTVEGVRNNILGTLSCANAAINTGVETFVLISTDKAVRPTNTMGATKRFAELVLQALAEDERFKSTRFTMVRFGNVLGSSGSVVPLFREQIAKGGPITVTDPRIIRYFMSIPEAAELVIQAGAMGHGGDVFVLDMGEPVKILDLAKRMIHLSGFVEKDTTNPDGDIEITYTGLRPGEKLYEELLIGDNVSDTSHPKILRAQEKVIEWRELEPILNLIAQAVESNDSKQLRSILKTHVEEFLPQCGVEDWLVN